MCAIYKYSVDIDVTYRFLLQKKTRTELSGAMSPTPQNLPGEAGPSRDTSVTGYDSVLWSK